MTGAVRRGKRRAARCLDEIGSCCRISIPGANWLLVLQFLLPFLRVVGMLSEEFLGFQCRHASHARSRHGLAIDIVSHVTRSEDAGYVGPLSCRDV